METGKHEKMETFKAGGLNYIGIDNGCSGSVGIIHASGSVTYDPTPTVRVLNYTKSKQFLRRIDGAILKLMLEPVKDDCFCMIERPLVNPGRWKATMSAMRAMEATLIVLEILNIPYQFIDSKEWQRVLLPSGLEKEELKIASKDVAKRLFPKVKLEGFSDGDGLLISEFCRRTKNGGLK